MHYFLVGLTCFVIGFLLRDLIYFLCERKVQGRFLIRTKNVEEDVFSVEFYEDMERLGNHSVIKLKVDKDY